MEEQKKPDKAKPPKMKPNTVIEALPPNENPKAAKWVVKFISQQGPKIVTEIVKFLYSEEEKAEYEKHLQFQGKRNSFRAPRSDRGQRRGSYGPRKPTQSFRP